MKKLLPVAAVLPFALHPFAADAAIIVSDDFSAPGSGTGWAADSNWGAALTTAGATVGVGFPQQVSRAFETPLDTGALDKLYIAFDFTQSGSGASWGGASFFANGGGTEKFFMGDPGNLLNYGIDGKTTWGPNVDSGIVVTPGATVRLIAELDFIASGSQSVYRMWVDSVDLNNPTQVSGAGGQPLGIIDSIRFGNDTAAGVGPSTYDNLIVATTYQEVGLVPEPSSLVLFGTAGLAFGFRRKRS